MINNSQSQEVLKRVKLLMEYDLEKTFKENLEVIEEQYVGGLQPAVPYYAQKDPEPPSDIKNILTNIDSAFCGVGIAEDRLKNAIRLITNKDTLVKVDNWLSKSPLCKDKRWNSVQSIYNKSFEGVTDNNKKKIAKKVTDHLKQIVGATGGAYEYFIPDGRTGQPTQTKGIKADKIQYNLGVTNTQQQTTNTQQQTTTSDRQKHINNMYCSLKNGVITAGGMYNGKKWEEYVYAVSAKPEEIGAAKKECPNVLITPKPKYTSCQADNYVPGCKSPKVKEVQVCLGMPSKYQTGNFGPNTQKELKKLGKGFEKGFKDANVTEICSLKQSSSGENPTKYKYNPDPKFLGDNPPPLNLKITNPIFNTNTKSGVQQEQYIHEDIYGSVEEVDINKLVNLLNEAKYQGREVKLGKIMQGDVKKFKVYVKNDKGNVVKVNFGFGGKSAKGKRMAIKKNNPKRRKSFRARHRCDNPGPRWKPRYWACKTW